MTDFQQMCADLEKFIEDAYNEGITAQRSEELAGSFLHANLAVGRELTKADLDARMRKAGTKAVRAAAYLDIVQKADKKPTEAQIEALLNTNGLVSKEQEEYDKAEVRKAELERLYSTYEHAHVFYRGVAKGRFD